MIALLPFYMKLTWVWIKKSYLILISISLTLSMIFATNAVIEGGLDASFSTNLETTSEFLITSPESKINSTEKIADEIATLQDRLSDVKEQSDTNQQLLEQYDTFPYLFFKGSWDSVGLRLHSIRYDDKFNARDYLESTINFHVNHPDYYQTDRFDSQFKIMEGRAPQQANEVLVPYIYKFAYNYELNDEFDMTYFLGEWSYCEYQEYQQNSTIQLQFPEPDAIVAKHQLNSTKIVGFYASTVQVNQLMGHRTQLVYLYQDFLKGEMTQDTYVVETPLFFSSDFDNLTIEEHPVVQFYNSIRENYTLFTAANQIYFDLSTRINNMLHYGLMFAMKFENLHYNEIIQLKQTFALTENVLQSAFTQEIFSRVYDDAYEYLQFRINSLRLASFAINIPLILFTFFIVFFSMRTGRKTRLDHFLQMNIKGVTKKQLKSQIRLEIFLISLICTVVGMLIALIFLSPVKETLAPLFFPSLLPNQIDPLITSFWGIFIFLTTLIILSISYRDLLKLLQQAEIPDLYDMKNEAYLPATYDETSVYDQIPKGKQANSVALYEDSVEGSEKKIPKMSFFLFGAILIPILFYGLILYSYDHDTLDFIEQMRYNLSYSYNVYLIFVLIIPVTAVIYGFYRFLVVESPRRFARFTRFITKPLNKQISYLTGLEMIRRKEFRYLILLLTFFTTAAGIINPLATTQVATPILEENLNLGVDCGFNLYFNDSIYKEADTYATFEKNLSLALAANNMGMSENTTFWSQVAEIYAEGEEDSQISRELFFFDYQSYLDMIETQDRFINLQSVEKALQKTIKYNEERENAKIGIIAGNSYQYYDNIEDFPPFHVNISYFDRTTQTIIFSDLECELVARVEYLPPVYPVTGMYGPGWGLFIDIANLLPENCSLVSNELYLAGNLQSQESQQNHPLTTVELTEVTELMEVLERSTDSYSVTQKDFSFEDYRLSLEILHTKYGFALYSLLFVSFTLCIGQGFLFIHINRENSPFYGNLMTRGVSRKQIFRFGLSQILYFFFLAIGIAAITLFAPLFFVLKLISVNTPILFNWPLIGFNFLLILGGSLLLYCLFFITQKRTKFFQQTSRYT